MGAANDGVEEFQCIKQSGSPSSRGLALSQVAVHYAGSGAEVAPRFFDPGIRRCGRSLTAGPHEEQEPSQPFK